MILDRVAVIGIGRIGLCLGLNLDRARYQVLGIDSDPRRVQLVRERSLRTAEPGVGDALRDARALQVEVDLRHVADFDPSVIFVAVDTQTKDGTGYHHGPVEQVLKDLFQLDVHHNRRELSLVCTTLPGFCDSVSPTVKQHGYALSYTPGFVAQGSIFHDQQYPDQILIGEADAAAGCALEQIFGKISLNQPSVHRMSPLSAEIAKLATNCALTMKIAFANAIGDLARQVGADPEKILAAVGADSRIGNKFLRYGFGYGGPCLPRDNRALNQFAQQNGREIPLAGATDETNRRHLQAQVEDYLQKHAVGEEVHFFSISYKPGTDMLEESQPLALALCLARAGRRVIVHEAPAVSEQLRAKFGDLFEYGTPCC